MGKGKRQKANLVKIVAPEEVSPTDPMVISFAYWRPEDLPRRVTIEVVEVDRSHQDDDDGVSAEDVIARFTGELQAAPDDTAQIHEPTLVTVTSPARSPDRVWLRFAHQENARAIEAGIPFSDVIKKSKKSKKKGKEPDEPEYIANEGAFYEVAVRVRDQGKGTELAMSSATAVRQRAFLLLAVEPLSQNNSGMNHLAGQKILSTFHPGREDEFKPRHWDGVVLRLRNHRPMRMGKAGCSYAIMTMVLRYLRVDAPTPAPEEPGAEAVEPTDLAAGATIRLFDEHIKRDLLDAHPDHKPRFLKVEEIEPPENVKEVIGRYWGEEREGFVAHFVRKAEEKLLDDEDKETFVETMKKFYEKKTENYKRYVLTDVVAEEGVDESPFYHPITKAIGDNDFVPLLIWRLHILEDRRESFAMRKRALSRHRLLFVGASDYRTLEHDKHDSWEPAYEIVPLLHAGERLTAALDHVTAGAPGIATRHDGGILIPLSKSFSKLFGLVEMQPYIDVVDYPEDQPGDPEMAPWQRYVVETLDRGLPVVGLFSPGQYSERNKGGHFILIVGYRYLANPDDPTKKRVRFILNDPAGGETLQYEGHDEQELNPPGLDPSEPIDVEKGGMKRERRGLNLVIDRRKRLSLREIRVCEPGRKTSTWDPARHARFLWFRGRVQEVNDA